MQGGYQNTVVKITASKRICTCVACKQKIPAGEAHVRIESMWKTYNFKLCKFCVVLIQGTLRVWDAQDGTKIIHEQAYKDHHYSNLEVHRHA